MATKKTQNKMRVIPKKNYFILLAIFIVSGIIFALAVEPFKKEEKQESSFADKLDKLDYGSLGEFITERQDILIYLTDFSEKSKNFEKVFEVVVKEEELNLEVVYMNTTEFTSSELNKIKTNYYSNKLNSSNVELKIIPNILIFQDGKIVDILYKIEKEYEKDEIKIFLENYGVINND